MTKEDLKEKEKRIEDLMQALEAAEQSLLQRPAEDGAGASNE